MPVIALCPDCNGMSARQVGRVTNPDLNPDGATLAFTCVECLYTHRRSPLLRKQTRGVLPLIEFGEAVPAEVS